MKVITVVMGANVKSIIRLIARIKANRKERQDRDNYASGFVWAIKVHFKKGISLNSLKHIIDNELIFEGPDPFYEGGREALKLMELYHEA